MATRKAEYNGKTYTLLYLGPTKFGRRAHLQFTDGSKDFWVDASLVQEVDGESTSSSSGSGRTYSRSRSRSGGRRTGCSCGSIEGKYHEWYSETCRFDELDQ